MASILQVEGLADLPRVLAEATEHAKAAVVERLEAVHKDLWRAAFGATRLLNDLKGDTEREATLDDLVREVEERLGVEFVDEPEGGVCRKCGCTDTTPCVDEFGMPCSWVEPDLCSACASVGEQADLGQAIVTYLAGQTKGKRVKEIAEAVMEGNLDTVKAFLERDDRCQSPPGSRGRWYLADVGGQKTEDRGRKGRATASQKPKGKGQRAKRSRKAPGADAPAGSCLTDDQAATRARKFLEERDKPAYTKAIASATGVPQDQLLRVLLDGDEFEALSHGRWTVKYEETEPTADDVAELLRSDGVDALTVQDMAARLREAGRFDDRPADKLEKQLLDVCEGDGDRFVFVDAELGFALIDP